MLNDSLIRRYRAMRARYPMLPARHCLSAARTADRGPWTVVGEPWEDAGMDKWTRELDGFTLTLRAEVESIYPADGDGYGEYVPESRWSGEDWRGNYPEPARSERFPLGLPYTAFRWTGIHRGDDGGYFLPDDVEEEYAYMRRCGQSRAVAWDMTRAWVERTLVDYFQGPLTYYGVTVSVEREGVELASASIGTSVCDDDAAAHFAELAEDLTDEAMDNAREVLARLAQSLMAAPEDIAARLEYLRGQIHAECISWGELAELQGLAEFIAPGDVELREWAGIPEHDDGA